ncbi:MAG: tRNA (adenosine(37)-N6)-dimethylallyltransferase MiaA [Bacteroidales bacterium]|nr:tRNA (adenosine(37)-N6)-dimethylallyltransferase MiaA [Bacteroidales bacterium]
MKRQIIIPPAPAELPEPETIDVEALRRSYLNGEIDLVCVLGPTASGKTRYAVQLARELGNVEIISADSRQVYRGMTIGTGKDLDEYCEIPYHLIDIVDAGEKYDIYRYQHDFEAAYKDIVERGRIPLLCGGSGLYIEAATCGYNLPDVPPNPQLRAELEQFDDEKLIARLASLKPLHNSTDYDTRKRLIRALEIAIYEAEHPVNRSAFLPKNTFYIGTLVSREVRNERIDRRLDARLEEGMVEEIKGLMEGRFGPAVKAEDLIYYGLEYKFVTNYLIGNCSYEQMRLKLATAIHQFAKRQMTWFRGMERRGIRIHWVQV